MKQLYQYTMIWPGGRFIRKKKHPQKMKNNLSYLLELHQRQARNPLTKGRNITLINSWHQNEYESTAR